MSRSVTKIVLGVCAPLVTLASIAIVDSLPKAKASSPHAAIVAMRLFGTRRAGPNDTALLDLDTPLPTPTPISAPAPPAAVPAGQNYGVAAHPVPPRPAPKPPAPRPLVGVGGAAGVEFSLVNQDRGSNGVAALAWSGALARVAQYRAQDMLNRNYFSHYDPSTGQLAFVELMHLWGIPYSTAGENIAWSTNPSMAAINVMFMSSPEHRANILNGAFHRVGIGVASDGVKTMVVEVFSN